MRRRFTGNSQGLIIDNYLTIVALEDGLTARFFPNICEYCIDGSGEWIVLSSNTETPAINAGQTLSFRASLRAASTFGIGQFVINKLCNLEGNCMSMLYADKAVGKTSLMGESNAFSNLFVNASTIVSVARGFLPATTLATSCYNGMFSGCTSLTTAPELPATTLARSCYNNMFYGCSNLNYIKMLATDISAFNCLYNWVRDVASTGTFVKSKDATWDVTGYSGVPSGWTIKKE